MTEDEWFAEEDNPYGLVNFLAERVSSRKAQLFACACFRHAKNELEAEDYRIIAIAEQNADGLITAAEAQEVESSALGRGGGIGWLMQSRDWWTAVEAARAAGEWEREAIQCVLVRDIFGNPFRPVTFDPAWRTDTAVALAAGMYESRDFGAMPILADALQDAGCDSDDLLSHCRDPQQTHARGCWVVDLVLGKE